jgi:hypothetical protein
VDRVAGAMLGKMGAPVLRDEVRNKNNVKLTPGELQQLESTIF